MKIEYVDKPVSAWGGLRIMKELINRSGVLDQLNGMPLPQPGSNRGYSPLTIIEAFWVSIWIGASRFIHADWLRYDTVLQKIFGWERVPSQSTYSRFFHKFSWKRNSEIFPKIQKWFIDQINVKNITLDFDSTVITRYSEQEGSRRGYNPHKPGRPSHHPILAFASKLRIVVNAWMRPGNTAAVSNFISFLEETFEILKDKQVGLVRADSGFYSDKVMKWFEKRILSYIIAVKLQKPIKLILRSMETWIEIAPGIQIAEFKYKAQKWKSERRFVAVRKDVRKNPKFSGKLLTLFDEEIPIWRYSVFVTNMELPNEQIWNLYRDRADTENRIKELKLDFGADNFCLKKFWATEAAFRFIMIS
ncbi:IS1380 family transposase [Bacteroidota bacterium]